MSRTPTSPDPPVWSLRALIAWVVAIWLVGGLLTFGVPTLVRWVASQPPALDVSRTGQIGDTFGAINSLFSALGVAGVAYALILQNREHRDAREEAAESKDLHTDLAVLAALISAESTFLQLHVTAHEKAKLAEVQTKGMSDRENRAKIVQRLKEATVRLDGSRQRLMDLVLFAEKRWGFKAEIAGDVRRWQPPVDLQEASESPAG